MKLGLIVLLAVAALLPLGAREGITVAVDLAALESFFYDTAHLRLDATLDLSDEFGLRLPLTIVAERIRNAPYWIEAGVYLDYHPLGWPFFISLSLAQVGVCGNHRFKDGLSTLFLNEMAFGWTIAIPPAFRLTPMVILRDPNRLFEDEYAELADLFSHFAVVRLSLLFGWTFPVGQPKAKRVRSAVTTGQET